MSLYALQGITLTHDPKPTNALQNLKKQEYQFYYNNRIKTQPNRRSNNTLTQPRKQQKVKSKNFEKKLKS
jgi:hypothetical protein